MPAKSCGTSSRCLAGAAQRCVASCERIGQPCRATWSSRGVALFSQAAFWRPCDSTLIPFGRGHLSLRLQHKLNALTDKRIRVVAVHSVVCVIDATGAVFLRNRPPFQRFSHCRLLG